MPDFNILREQMVDTQLRTNAITDYQLISAFLNIPREIFLPASKRPLAYLDTEIRIAYGDQMRVIHDPRALGHLLKAANISPDDSVLEVGSTIGYSAAVMSKLAATVTIFDENEESLATIAETMIEQEIATVFTKSGDLSKGYPEAKEKFNVILIHGALEQSPDVYFSNLEDGGKLVCIELENDRCVIKRYQMLQEKVTGIVIETIQSYAATFLKKEEVFAF